MSKMTKIRIEKLTLNVGAGSNQDMLKKGMKLIKNILISFLNLIKE